MVDHNLYNQKSLKRLCKNIKITQEQKEAAERWLRLLQKKKLLNEKNAYIEFANTILRDLLNYNINIEELKHEENYMEFLFKDSSKSNLVVFEAKGTKTKDLWAPQGRSVKIKETPVNQINYYLMHNKIPYGVLTNYKEFVLFKREEGDSKFHKIDFLEIKNNQDKLKEFIFIFSKESFEKDDTTKLYKDSIVEERNLTKEFYKLYHETRLMILKEFKESELENEICLHCTQLFLNRLMFIFFAEDTGKLPTRIFEKRILDTLEQKSLISDHSKRVSETIRELFESVDKGATTPDKIFGFNGGLFKAHIPQKFFLKI